MQGAFEFMDTKDTNPKDVVGVKKAGMSYVPSAPLLEVSLAFLEGHLKYRRHNYRVSGVRYSVYYDAAMRHLMSAWEGEDIDPRSGLPHLAKAMACLIILRDAEMQGKLLDDRPPPTPEHWVERCNTWAEELIASIPATGAPHTKERNG